VAKFPIYASRERTIRTPSRQKQLLKHRNGILQSAQSIRFAGWTKNNFQAAIGARPSDRICVVSLDVEHQASDGEPFVALSDGEEIGLATLIDQLDHDTHAGSLVLLEGEWTPALETLLHSKRSCVQLVHATTDSHDALFAFCCEFALFWQLESAISPEVSRQHLLNCGLRLLRALADRVSASDLKMRIGNAPDTLVGIAWHHGERFAREVDIEKTLEGARPEQQADTLKRVADAAATLRLEHQAPRERMVSSQGLFWLCELAHVNDVQDWLADTRFFKELFPDLLAIRPAARFHFDPERSQTVARHVLAALTEVPGGIYLVGSSDVSVASEPPANPIFVEVADFAIMRTLFSTWLWEELTGICDTVGNYPVTNVSYFDIRDAAEAMTSALAKLGQPVRLDLPSEYQWEIAARGSNALPYPWGLNFDANRCNCEMKLGQPSECGAYSPEGDSPFGCSDMSGNVREWTRSYAGTRGVDWQQHDQDRVSARRPITPSSRLVLRGGSYSYDRACVQCWVRNTQIASRRDSQTGFRLVAETIR
jgi:formylglycine-generating enzyme required for sulfatase activity